MLRPSYSELMELLNQDIDVDSKITSRYTIVIAAAKRARQIINGAACDPIGATTDKAVSVAVNEMIKGEIKIFPEGLPQDEAWEEATEFTSPSEHDIAEELTFDKSYSGNEFDDGVYDDADFEDVNDKFDENFVEEEYKDGSDSYSKDNFEEQE